MFVVPVLVLAVIATTVALFLSGAVFAPVACALFIIAMVWPLQRGMQAVMPQMLALAIVFLVIAVTMILFASVMTWSFSRIGRSLIADSGRFQALYNQLAEWLEGHGVAVAGVVAEHFNVGRLVRLLQSVTTRLNTTISFWIVVTIYVVLGLLDIDPIARNARSALSAPAARVLINGSIETAARLRRYMVVRSVMSVLTGLMVWALSAAFGLRFAVEWGVIAFTLNYIPFVGAFFATLLPALYALGQFGSLQSAVVIFAFLNVVQFVTGSYIEPRVTGQALSISPFVVLLSVFFWAFLWGLFGAFIGVPITIAILTFCAQSPSTLWIAQLLGVPKKGEVAEPS